MSLKTVDDEAASKKKGEEQVVYWLKEISDAKKREKDFRKEGVKTTKIYEGRSKEKTEYNILFSNTDTLAPALYNTTPRPVVQRRFKDEDILGKDAAQVSQRMLEFMIDNGEQQYSTFDDLMRAAVLEALVPGRGITRFKFDAEITGDEGKEKVGYENVCGEEVPWDRFCHGYGKKWTQVPWEAFEHHMTREELRKNFGDWTDTIPVESGEVEDDGGDEARKDNGESGESAGVKLVIVQEIWDKINKRVIFVTEAYKDKPLKDIEDPLKLTGFYPNPKPMTFVQKISTIVPVALYNLYEKQAEELNVCTLRINKLLKACRVHGMYDQTVEGMADALNATDNQLIPINNVAAQVAQGLTLEKSIWLFPLEKIITVLQQLYLARQQIKSVIFEITGIADIMRGSSQASETLGAQEIKNQWGTLRLKRVQKEVMRYVRDCLRIMTEIGVTNLSQKTIQAMTGLPYPTAQDKQAAIAQLQQQMQQFQMQQQAAAQQAQMTGQPPPPAQPPQPDPALVTAAQSPTWEDILGLLKNDLTRCYKIDIETNSTVDAEATEDKQNISELLNAMAQFLNGVSPLVENGSLPFEAAQAMLLAIVRRFRFGSDVEDALKQMKPPQPPDDGKAKAEEAKLALAQKQGEQQMAIAKATHEHDQQMQGLEMENKREEMRLQREMMLLEAELKKKEFEFKMAEMGRKAQLAEVQGQQKMSQMAMQGALAQTAHAQQTDAVAQKADVASAQSEAKIAAAKTPPVPKKDK